MAQWAGLLCVSLPLPPVNSQLLEGNTHRVSLCNCRADHPPCPVTSLQSGSPAYHNDKQAEPTRAAAALPPLSPPLCVQNTSPTRNVWRRAHNTKMQGWMMLFQCPTSRPSKGGGRGDICISSVSANNALSMLQSLPPHFDFISRKKPKSVLCMLTPM